MDEFLRSILTPEVEIVIKILAVVIAVFHLVAGIILFIQVSSVNKMVQTPHGNLIRALGVLHILLLSGILLLIVLY